MQGNERGGLGAGELGLVWRVSQLEGPCWLMLKNDLHPGSMGHMGPDPLALYMISPKAQPIQI